MKRVLAIDPGTRHTGLALVDEHGVSCAQTVSFPGKSLGTDNAAIIERCELIAQAVKRIAWSWPHDIIVMEGYEPFVVNGRVNAAAAVQCPFLVGYIAKELHDDEVVHIQYSREVLRPVGGIYALYGIKAKGMEPEEARKKLMEKVPGGYKCHTDHERAAAAHALWWLHEDARLFEI